MIAILILSFFLILSLIANGYLFYLFNFRSPSKEEIQRQQSVELQEFLADLMGGVGIVAVSRIDPMNILLRSPKK